MLDEKKHKRISHSFYIDLKTNKTKKILYCSLCLKGPFVEDDINKEIFVLGSIKYCKVCRAIHLTVSEKEKKIKEEEIEEIKIKIKDDDIEIDEIENDEIESVEKEKKTLDNKFMKVVMLKVGGMGSGN